MDWYRRHLGTCRASFLEMVARASGLPRPYAIAAWDAVEEYAEAQADRGSLAGLTAEWLSIESGCTEEEGRKLLAAFVAKGLIVKDPQGSGSRIVWQRPQVKDPGGAVRMARLRERRKAPPNGKADQGGGVTSVTPRHEDVTDRNSVRSVTSRRSEQDEPGSPTRLISESESVLNTRTPPPLRGVTPRRGGAETRGCRLPPDFQPDLDKAVDLGLSPARAALEADKFRDHWSAKPGRDGRKLDWQATWRNWCRSALEFGGRLSGRSGPVAEGMFDSVAQELAAEEAAEAARRDREAANGQLH